MEDPVLSCCVNIEWTNSMNVNVRKILYKSAKIIIRRNGVREIFLEIMQEKQTTTKLQLKDINVFKKFMNEGKATIKFNHEKANLYISNAPPGSLMLFLKTLFIKLTKEADENKNLTKEEVQQKLRKHLLSGNTAELDEISPVTNAELERAKKLAVSKGSITTPSPPSRKRRLNGDVGTQGAPKRLYAPSPLTTSKHENTKTETVENPDDIAMTQTLNDEQTQILNSCINGQNVFFTGSAGTGKSFLLRKVISTLPPDGTVVTASTGVAACLIGGVTLHSFAAVGGGDHSLSRSIEMASRQVAAAQWRKCKRLIIDEISMVDAGFFDLIEEVAREIRRNDKPFGGIQLIVCGDFFQLPPVVKMDKGNIFEAKNRQPANRFCFQAKSWQKCIQNSFELRKIYRQKDPKFVDILNSIRIGRVTPEHAECLLRTASQKIESNGIVATRLCSHTKDADSINQSKLAAIKSQEKTFEAIDSDIYLTKTLDSQLPVPGKLVLKIGAQVMLLKNLNLSNGLVNGARGVVKGFSEGFPVVRFKNNIEYTARPEKWVIKTPGGNVLQRKQIPLKLAWAFSIHKSQGLTLDCLEMSLSKVFEAGQAYVALSRAQSLDSLRILDFDAKQVFADPLVLQFYRSFRRMLNEAPTFIPLGRQKKTSDVKSIAKGLKLSKSIMDKPIVTIC